jgi:hypothetical protein
VDEGEDESKLKVCGRLLVKKLGKEFVVKVEDIEWLESSGECEITFNSGKTLNLSRSYKEDFRLRLE